MSDLKRVHNFNPGPGVLPLEVLQEAQAELLNFKNTGMSIMEISHRSKEFEAMIQTAVEPFVPAAERVEVEDLGHGVARVRARYGFTQSPRPLTAPAAAASAGDAGTPSARRIATASRGTVSRKARCSRWPKS